VHRLDAAHLYRLALEKGAGGANYHGVADEGVPFRDITGAIGRRLGMPVAGKSGEAAASHFGWMAPFALLDAPASSRATREQLGWQPRQIGLLADLDHPRYFGS
jgi:nucleoside-diphosphate-sugar epimerase